MATRFVQQAEQQVNPLFQQQIQAQQAQIPAIQQLYQTLTQGLQQQAQRELQTGTQSILEDASRRGVLRSTLPVDARTELQAAISQGLIGRMGELGLQQARDISGIQSNIANLGIERLRTITSLADALQAQDLREREFAMRQQAAREEAARQQATAPSGQELQIQAINQLAGEWKPGRDGYVSPNQWNDLRARWIRAGGDPELFDQAFAHLVNPAHQRRARSDLKRYAGIPIIED